MKTPNATTISRRSSHLVMILSHCLAREWTHKTWNRPLSAPTKHCLNLYSFHVISTLMNSSAQSARVYLIISKYHVYCRLCTHVWQKTAWDQWLSPKVTRREEFAEGPGGQGLWKQGKKAGQGCTQLLPPGEHTSPSNLEQNLTIFVSHHPFLSMDE